MTELTIEKRTLQCAEIGDENPLPALFTGGNLHESVDVSSADDELRRNAEYGRVPSIAPYLLQDGYDRVRRDVEHTVAVLENDELRAEFLLDLGGRLWSLVHKRTGRELLFSNDRIQFANLALRNAWFAGGVEWNIGTIGHSPSTCSPMHAARVRHPDGTPVLRMYEFERIREVVYQVDVHLPDGSEALFVAVRIVNANDHDVPMYWWSNIAVPQTESTRVLVPADHAWNYTYDATLRQVPIVTPERDASYPGRADAANDYFFDLDGVDRPWIVAVDADGQGLAQASTPRLRGRKLFVWGTGAGGRHWQEWLSGQRREYAEIQAGLARTQFEHVRMPAGAEWSWVEAYGPVSVAPERVHTPRADASAAAQDAVDRLVPPNALEREAAVAAEVATLHPEAVVNDGTGWGALEHARRARHGDRAVSRAETPFDEATLGAEQRPWMELLAGRGFTVDDPSGFLPSFEVHPQWEALLQGVPGWAAAAMRGVMRAYRHDFVTAKSEWKASVAVRPNALAWRNLAALSAHEGELEQACDAYEHALALAPAQRALIIEALRAFLAAGHPSRAIDIIDSLPEQLRANGRIRFLEAEIALELGDLDRCERLLGAGLEIPDLREGEDSLHDLWWRLQDRRRAEAAATGGDFSLAGARRLDLPDHLNFRMQ